MGLFDLILHIDKYMLSLVNQLGIISYLLLFLIVFAETGLVVAAFLPGDSLLFAVGTIAGRGVLNIYILIPTLIIAAIVGDSLNYWIGHRLGAKTFSKENAKVFKPQYLKKTEDFYEKHGGKTIILARFVPLVRTFAPFVAGVGKMRYSIFFAYNVTGAVIWVVSITMVGYFFGQIPFIQENFEYAVLAIVAVSVIPAGIEMIKHKRKYRAEQLQPAALKQELKETFEDLD